MRHSGVSTVVKFSLKLPFQVHRTAINRWEKVRERVPQETARKVRHHLICTLTGKRQA